jgi:4-amino-4-deoxy-L-arabinose transferase-like glycosyltransferase
MYASLSMNSKRLHLLEAAGLVLIILMAALVRYPNLETNPGWYSDEGTLIDIASHLSMGETRYMAINGPLLLVGRQPLFVGMLALIFRMTGPGIVPLRMLSATLGIITIVMLYLMIRACLGVNGIPLAFLSALMLTLSPMGITYSRVAFSYSLSSPLLLITMLASWKYAYTGKRFWLMLATFAVGLAAMSDFLMLAVLAPVLIIVLIRRWQDIFYAVGIALLPAAVYISVLLITQTHETVFDLQYLFSRSSGLSPLSYLPSLIINYGLLISHDQWFLPALIGMFLIKPFRFGQFLLIFWVLPIMIMVKSVNVAGIGYYYTSPFLSLVALGLGAIILYGIPKMAEVISDVVRILLTKLMGVSPEASGVRLNRWIRIITIIAIISVVLSPLSYYYFNSLYQVNTRFTSSLDWILVDPLSGKAAIDYVNENTSQEDLVIASPALAWKMDCRTAEFQMVLAIDGIKTPHLPGNINPSRFAYDTHLALASYAILDPVWENFGIKSIPEVAQMAEFIRNEWVLVFEDGDVQIYDNPAMIQ